MSRRIRFGKSVNQSDPHVLYSSTAAARFRTYTHIGNGLTNCLLDYSRLSPGSSDYVSSSSFGIVERAERESLVDCANTRVDARARLYAEFAGKRRRIRWRRSRESEWSCSYRAIPSGYWAERQCHNGYVVIGCSVPWRIAGNRASAIYWDQVVLVIYSRF